MKEVHPSEIKTGDYYIQDMGDFILLKKRIRVDNEKQREIWGEYIKILKEPFKTFKVGATGFSFEGDNKIRWYLLSEGEAMLYMI